MIYGVAVVVLGVITLAVLGLYWHLQRDLLALLKEMAGIKDVPKVAAKSRIIHPYKLKREGGDSE